MKNYLSVVLLHLFPKYTYTKWLGKFVETSISRVFIKTFVRHYRIDLADSNKPIGDYATFGEFFRRSLRPGARPIGDGIVSPVDGEVRAMGQLLHGETLLQVKGRAYGLRELLADVNSGRYAQFVGGSYVTLYLSPRDYHRIHAPLDSVLIHHARVPGALFPVNSFSTRHIDGLFVKNERVVSYFRSKDGPYAMVMVGAAGVGTVKLTCVPLENASDSDERVGNVREMPFRQGDEIGYFALGSTVILLFPKEPLVEWEVAFGQRVRMGETIARWSGPDIFVDGTSRYS